MNDSLAWVACRPLQTPTPAGPVRFATHLAFTCASSPVAPGTYYQGYLRTAGDKPAKAFLRVLGTHPQARDRQFVARFDASGKPPGVISPWGVLATEIGYVVAAPFANGLTIEEIQKRTKVGGVTLPTSLALEITGQLLGILSHLHPFSNSSPPREEQAHGAIRPATIHVGIDGQLRLLDMGSGVHSRTREGRSEGDAVTAILPYLAPEQLVDAHVATPRTDLYATAAIAYELIAGKPLFNGSAARRELEIRAGFGVREKVRGIGAELPGFPAVLEKALSLAPHERYASASAMLEVVNTFRDAPRVDELANLVQRLKTWRPVLVPPANDAAFAQPPKLDKHPLPGGEQRSRRGAASHRQRPRQPGHGIPRDRLSRTILGLVGAAVAVAAYAWVSAPVADSQPSKPYFDSALHAKQGLAHSVDEPVVDHSPRSATD